ncbi:MAG: FxsA family protein [Rhodospirillaceae bacterium]|nr:FxsA family protein [Rhodospirillaceae bacterium]
MGFLLLILVIGLPLAEIFVFIQVGEAIGAMPTIVLTVATALFGIACVRWQGLGVLMRLHAAPATGEPPAVPLLEGALIALAGVLLLIPGFLTDAAGLILLLPPARSAIAHALARRSRTYTTDLHGRSGGPGQRPGQRPPPVIDAEAREVDPDQPR